MSQLLSPIDFISQTFDSDVRFDYLQSSTDLLYYPDHSSFRKDSSEKKINHNLVHCYYGQQTNYTVNIQDLMNYYNSFSPKKDPYYSSPDSLDVIIPGLRYFSPGIIIFERPPSYQHVSVYFDHRDNINEDSEDQTFYLPIPWQVYIATYNPEDMRLIDVRMYFTHDTLHSVDQPLFAPPIFNFFSNGKLCRPFFESIDDIEKYDKTINGLIAASFDWVWNSGFNLDITENISQFLLKKKFTQFEEYVKDPKLIKYYNYLVNNQLTGIPSSLSRSYIISLFRCWEQVPIQNISSIGWSPFAKADFFYREEIDQNDVTEFVDRFIEINNISVHEYEDDHYDEDGEPYCPDNCMTEEDLLSSSSFRYFVQTQTSNLPEKKRSLKDAMNQTIEEVYSYRRNLSRANIASFRKMFYEHTSIFSRNSA